MVEQKKSIIDRKELVDLLGKLVSYDTVNDLPKGKRLTKDCPEFIVNYLKNRGIQSSIYEEEGFYSVYGKVGDGQFNLLLAAHFDVVPIGDGWDTDPFTMVIKDGLAFGRGVIDNKNNIASIIAILPEIKRLGLTEKLTIWFEFSGDEEIGGRYGAGKFREKFGRLPDAVINADGHGELIISRRRNGMGATIIIPKKLGKMNGAIEKKTFLTEQYGRHTAYQHPGADIHCLLRASRDINFNNWKVISCQGKFLKGNVVPDSCELVVIVPTGISPSKEIIYDVGLTELLQNLGYIIRTQFPTEFSTYGITISPNLLIEKEDQWELGLDIRAMTQDYTNVEAALREMCDELFGENTYELIFKPGQGRVNTAKDALIIQTALETSNEYGFPLKVVEMGGASDARYFSREGIPTFDFGPIGGGVHANNEWVNLESFYNTTNYYLEVIKKLHSKL